MKLIINRKPFSDALSELASLSSKKSPLPILRHVKFVTKGNRVRLQTSDGTITMRKYLDAVMCNEDCEFCVDCNALHAFVSNVKSDNVELAKESEELIVAHENGSATFGVVSADNFPEVNFNESESALSITLPASTLASIINNAKSYIGNDALRPVMHNIYVHVANGTLEYAATDTRRMYFDHMDTDNPDAELLISELVFSAVVKACIYTDTATIQSDAHSTVYTIGSTKIYSPLNQDRFPDCKRVIPQTLAVECSINRQALLDGIKRASTCVSESSLLKLKFSMFDLLISASNDNYSRKAAENVPCNCNNEVTIGIRSDFLANAIAGMKDEEVTIKLNDSSRPIIITEQSSPNKIVLIMPMNIN